MRLKCRFGKGGNPMDEGKEPRMKKLIPVLMVIAVMASFAFSQARAENAAVAGVTKPLEPPTVAAKGFSWPAPAEGERLYIGEAHVSQAKRMYMAFVVSADGTTLHDLTIHSEGIAIEYKSGGGVTRLTGGSITEKTSGSLSVGQTAIDIDLGETQIDDLAITGDTASCTLAYVYRHTDAHTGTPISLPFDVATIMLENYSLVGAPTARPAIQPPTAAEIERRGFKLPAPADGESVYIGAANVSQANKLYAAFILSADGTQIHDLTVYIADLSIKIKSGNTVTQLTGGSVTGMYSGLYDVGENASAINLGKTQITDFVVTGDTASCVLAYVYHYSGSPGSGASSADVPFDIAAVSFQRQ